MKKNRRYYTFLGIGIFLLIFLITGFFLDYKIKKINVYATQQQLSTNAYIESEMLADKFKLEFERLNFVSSEIQESGFNYSSVLTKFESDLFDFGFVNINGKFLYGTPIDQNRFLSIRKAFMGEMAVSNTLNEGLVFSVPVYKDNEIISVLYKFISVENLEKYFNLSVFDGKGKSCVIDKDGMIVFSAVSSDLSDFWYNRQTQVIFEKCLQELKQKKSDSVKFNHAGVKNYLFVSEISGTDFLLAGIIEDPDVSFGRNSILSLSWWILGIFFILFIICIFFILSEEQKVQESESLREEKITAENANNAKSDFLRSMSHEIRTPISGIIGMNEMILREATQDNIRSYAQDIQSAGNNLLSIVNDLLDFSKIEAGKMEIVKVPYDISSVFNDIYNIFSNKAEEKKLAFEIKADENLPSQMLGDSLRIQQILINLLNNSIKYTKEGFVKLEACFERLDSQTVNLIFNISDSGIGIKEEDKAKLFTAFQRLDTVNNYYVDGTGLGLVITSRLISQMNGEISFESEYGKGSVFTVKIVQNVTDFNPIGDFKKRFDDYKKNNAAIIPEKFIAPDAKVLLVDDNAMNLHVAKSLLKHTQVQVTLCESGFECLSEVTNNHYDIIFLDHMMPEMDGIETLKKLKNLDGSKCSDTPIVALTANAMVGVREMYLSEGFDDYLAKPINGELLEDMLKKFLNPDLIKNINDEKLSVKNDEISVNSNNKDIAENAETDESMKNLINEEEALVYCANDRAMFLEILEVYVGEAVENIAKLDEYFSKEDWKNYVILAHAVKSTSKTIGADKLSELAKFQEFSGKENRIDDLKLAHAGFISLIKEVIEHAKELLKQG